MSDAPVRVASLLETDLYKLTMLQPFLHRHPDAQMEYRFVCRNQTEFPLSEIVDELNLAIDALCLLTFTNDELTYLRSLRFIKSDFVDFLQLFHFQRHFIRAWADGDTLEIRAEGPVVHTMGFEIHILSLVNEIYSRRVAARSGQALVLQEGRRRLTDKIDKLKQFARSAPLATPFEFFDFGLRRRFSGSWHEEVVSTLRDQLPDMFRGTSNVYLARKFDLTPIGTMAHEYLQSFQGFEGVRLKDFQKAALEEWVQEYRGDLGIALTDVVGMDAFLADFDLYLAKLFDGLRHDSGDPVEWGEKALAHYRKLRVNPMSKRLVFSDGLDVETAIRLYRHFGDRTPTGFGIGNNLSNDLGIKPLNIVMKLVSCNGQPVAKLSDSPGKTLCKDETFLSYLRQVFHHREPAAH